MCLNNPGDYSSTATEDRLSSSPRLINGQLCVKLVEFSFKCVKSIVSLYDVYMWKNKIKLSTKTFVSELK